MLIPSGAIGWAGCWGAFGSAWISPVIVNWVVAGDVLAVIVTYLVWTPDCPAGLYSTAISPVSPGAIGSFGHFGTVHPQDPFAFDIINGSVPVFVNLNVCLLEEVDNTCPKSFFGVLKFKEVKDPVGAAGAWTCGFCGWSKLLAKSFVSGNVDGFTAPTLFAWEVGVATTLDFFVKIE